MMLQNLLPREQKKKLEQEYYIRLVAVAMLILASAVVVCMVALLPAYMSVSSELALSEVAYKSQQKNVEDSKLLNEEVAQSAETVAFLEKKYTQGKLTTLLREVLRERPEGITITGFSYTRNKATLALQGVASTRDLILPYARTLESGSLCDKASVPTSVLAKNTNVDFTLSIELEEYVK